ncbi:LCP family protein [Pengzhenrongella sp.]|uniref:LCP family protein n=1 Tax=Pengzhenrongella sp. TaxID=2888820 RepID=UPI002F94B2F1
MRRRRAGALVAFVIVLLLAWPIGLLIWANGKIDHVDALSTAANTPGVTYLIAGSDSRAGGIIQDTSTKGARTDTIMLLHVPANGPPALISLPRDTYVAIPGKGHGKLNASFAIGGAPLLVKTVEQLTTIHIDHYVEIGFGGVEHVVDAIGGVRLCLDDPALSFPMNDKNSGLVWAKPGCKVVDGVTALAFTRMRYSDPTGDIGRAKRQQQLIAAVTAAVAKPSLALHPGKQVQLTNAGLGSLAVSKGTNIVSLGRLALAFHDATGPGGVKGTPPISDPDYRPGGVGSTVRLDPDKAPKFFKDVMNGTLTPGPVGGLPTP